MTATALPPPDRWRADAVRYRMLWRLVPSVNHKLAGAMQPVSLLAGMVARQMQRPQPEIPTVVRHAVDMQQACKAAVATRTDVMTWFQPSETKRVSLVDEAAQCCWLLTAEFAIRGCSINNVIADVQGEVLQTCLRTMCVSTLLAILDNASGPVAVQLGSLPANGDGVTIVASWTPLESSYVASDSNGSHRLSWDDLQAVAVDLGVALQRTTEQIELTFTLAT